MLHRRPTGLNASPSGPSTSIPASPPTGSTSRNKTYTPLRRQSSGLYNTPASGPKARYNLPSPSPSYIGIYGGTNSSGVGGGVGNNGGGGLGGGMGGGGGYGDSPGFGGLGIGNGNGHGFGGGNGKGSRQKEILHRIREGIEGVRLGFGDGIKLERSLGVVWSDRELRTLVLKSSLINLLSLLLLSLFPLILAPLLRISPRSATASDATREVGWWYNILLSWPVFVVCFWINASWGPEISKRAQTMLHPTLRNQPTPSSGVGSSSSASPISFAVPSVTRLLLISDFTLLTRIIELVPLIGKPTALAYMCVINAYYCFEWTFSSRGWPLEYRVRFMQDRAAYMLGFGLVPTLLSSFGPPLINMAVFALIYPFFVIQALQSRPPTPRSSLLPSTPSPQSSLPPSPSGGESLGLSNPFFAPLSSTPGNKWEWEPRLPLFFFARYALEALGWLEVALGRERGARRFGTERSGKRAG
ncbi:etoposide-induced protein 2.4-domain-containing protein [Naematelia encephala]|uniref:Etoposide-induced protein 2.4-domain-containing protein n=1 Tax=Naematelia encephala TaxID=71784 RepID=A0A1Y2BCQ5_9TREE|nr:etoposide-induced protein 2.4-domain-containing protein [Naematelia encephala]